MRAETVAVYDPPGGEGMRDLGRDSARIERRAGQTVADGRLRLHRRALDRLPTPRPSPPLGPMQRLLAALEGAWATIRGHHAEIPEVVVLIATGSDRGALRKLGHFAARRWRLADGGERSEILIAGEGLDRGPGSVFATLLHEAAHALAFARGIRDTSRGGRYHNRRFMAVATEFGLQVGALRPYGLAATTMPSATAARYSAALDDLAGALVLWRATELPRGRTRNTESPALCLCGCPRQLRLPRSILEGPPVVCGECGAPFLPRPSGGRDGR